MSSRPLACSRYAAANPPLLAHGGAGVPSPAQAAKGAAALARGYEEPHPRVAPCLAADRRSSAAFRYSARPVPPRFCSARARFAQPSRRGVPPRAA